VSSNNIFKSAIRHQTDPNVHNRSVRLHARSSKDALSVHPLYDNHTNVEVIASILITATFVKHAQRADRELENVVIHAIRNLSNEQKQKHATPTMASKEWKSKVLIFCLAVWSPSTTYMQDVSSSSYQHYRRHRLVYEYVVWVTD
jgi:hypothetical protein